MGLTDYIYKFLYCVHIVANEMLPYMKYVLFLFLIVGFLWVNRLLLTDPKLRPLFIESFQDENNRVSGKSISAFACVASLLLSWFIAILYDKNHVPPEYMAWILAGLITSFYGIKEVGKVMGAKFNSPFTSDVTGKNVSVTQTTTTNNAAPIVEEKKKEDEPIV